MRKLIGFIVTVCTFWGSLSFSSTNWTENAVVVTPGSDMQKQIDEVTMEIFNYPLELCMIYKNASSIYYSLGVSPDAALAIAKNCKQQADAPAKTLMKHYYISFAKSTGLDSWTDFANNTYIFVDGGLSRQRLKSIILHEIAIATDAKANMLYSTYLGITEMYKAIQKNPNAGGDITVYVDVSTDYQKALQQAFNYASWSPLSRAFATIRAFALEAQAEGRPNPIQNQTQCASTVRAVLQVMKDLPAPPKATGKDDVDLVLGFVEDLRNAVDKTQGPKSPEHEEAILNFLLSPQLKLKDINDTQRSFCDFMTRPLLINRSVYSMFGAGPRPRLSGGSGGQGRDNETGIRILPIEQPTLGNNLETQADIKLREVLEKMKLDNKDKASRQDLLERPSIQDSREQMMKRAITQPSSH